jgi:hypothetical protein
LQATFTGADALVPLMKRDSAIWGKVIKDGNIKVEQ